MSLLWKPNTLCECVFSNYLLWILLVHMEED